MLNYIGYVFMQVYLHVIYVGGVVKRAEAQYDFPWVKCNQNQATVTVN